MAFWTKCALILAGIWIVAGAAIYWSRHVTPTAQSVKTFLNGVDVEVETGRTRARTITSLETQLNEISFDDRQELERSGMTRHFFLALTPAERLAFLDATLPAGFKQWMDAFNKMDHAKRQQIVDGALAEMKKHEGESRPAGPDGEMAQRFIDQGMRSYEKDANAQTKLDLAPLVEEMQKNARGGGE